MRATAIARDLTPGFGFASVSVIAINVDSGSATAIARAVVHASEKTTAPELKQALESLRKQLPSPQDDQSAFRRCCLTG
ncbi:hypothetical protein H6F76_01520 [Leptolyngbya sp. FACHB-321]|uniref:hypothetical protein n=1 Tax=Leptolyngbya sp. FACHB-321 TaxID=2692807 RepID=UPI001689FF9C|nr:hypothetical protein [Leptolyngbya sp. FACHB-321]MBD2033744.1 hypothetical protein [Leptolyngbya sp. FACHB-321]